MLDRYFELLPAYQGVDLDKLRFKRVLFAGLPCYADGPLKPGFDRILQVPVVSIMDVCNVTLCFI